MTIVIQEAKDPVPCEDWLIVKVLLPTVAYLYIAPHPGQGQYPYLVGYDCQPSPPCSGGEFMVWPNGPYSDHFEFHSPQGGTYNIIVAQMGHRGCVSVRIPPPKESR